MKSNPVTYFLLFLLALAITLFLYRYSKGDLISKQYTFSPGDCISFTGEYDIMEPHFSDKYIVASINTSSYQVFTPSDLNLDNPTFIRFSTAKEFKVVPCNGGVK